MKTLIPRFASGSESETIKDWMRRTPEADLGILDYPTCTVLASENGAGPIAYLPAHTALMIESVAMNPNAINSLAKAEALNDLMKAMFLLASGVGIKEVYFLNTDEKIAKLAKKRGFEELPFKLLRLKL